ncbi:MAG: TRAP transporter large permease [Phycisphaerales bacterium]|nr:TRAP transporter large permease [Phycisphaerales bacterium]
MTWAPVEKECQASRLSLDEMHTTEAIILLGVFAMLLAVGVPIAFSIGLSTLVTMLLLFDVQMALTTMAQRMATGADAFVLLAIPFFILAGQIMNRGGIARRIIAFARSLVGMFPGGLAFVNIVSAMFFGALSGSAVAAASAIGGVMSPHMDEAGYDRGFSAAVNITASTTGLIIPPSNVLIVYAFVSGGSIATLFMAGYLPGLLVGVLLMAVTGIIARRRGYPTAGRIRVGEVLRTFLAALPSLGLIVVVIGGIIAGVFTATEAAAVAVFYALVLAFIYRELRAGDLSKILLESAQTTSIVLLLVATSMCMSWVLVLQDVPQSITEAIMGISANEIVVLALMNVILLVVGTFMDITPAVLIFTPIFLPIATKLGMDPTHFGIMMVLNLCIGLCTPPVGSVLFVGCSVGKVSMTRVVRPMLPLYIAMIIALLLVAYIPAISLWLPQLLGE